MTTQLSKAQIEALKVELGRYGLEIRPTPKPRKSKVPAHVAAIKAMKPVTPEGKVCKARMLKYAMLPPIVGASNYQIKDWRGNWLVEGHPKFARAKIYQARVAADIRANPKGHYINA